MPGVYQFAAEFDHLVIRKVIAQREHAAADAFLRFEHARPHTLLAQAPGSGQSGDAGADDDHFVIRPRAHRIRYRAATREQGAGACALQQAAPASIKALRLHDVVEFVQRHAHVARCAGDGSGTLQQAEERRASHGGRFLVPFSGKRGVGTGRDTRLSGARRGPRLPRG